MGLRSAMVYLWSFFRDEVSLVTVRSKALSKFIQIRTSTVDESTLLSTFHYQYHLPPIEFIPSRKPIFIDFGSNIGYTCCHLANLYPDARIYGYELDEDNYDISLYNIKSFPNIEVTNQGVWFEDAELSYSLAHDADAFSLSANSGYEESSKKVAVASIDNILLQFEHIDFVKMDIEGAELSIFDQGAVNWLDKVQAINIEFHLEGTSSLDKYIKIIQEKGLIISSNNNHWSSIVAYRP